MRIEGLNHLKVGKDPHGIEPVTSRLVAQHLNQLNVENIKIKSKTRGLVRKYRI
jgi:hypothetical protein